MESSKADAPAQIIQIIEDLKASKTEIQSQHAHLGLQISTFESRISTLEALLRDYAAGTERASPTPTTPAYGSAATVNLTVVAQDGSVSVFQAKRCYPLRQIMNRWCVHQHQQLTYVVFLYKGRFLRADRTPDQLDMEDGDEIRVENRWV